MVAKPTLWSYSVFVHCRLPMAKVRVQVLIAVLRNREAKRRQRPRDTFQIILQEIHLQLPTRAVEPLLHRDLKELCVHPVKTVVTRISTTEVLLRPVNGIKLHQRLNADRILPCDLHLILGTFAIFTLAYCRSILNFFFFQRFSDCLQLQRTRNAANGEERGAQYWSTVL